MSDRATLIVALDVADLPSARRLIRRLRPQVVWFKVGAVLFTACGPASLQAVRRAGGRVFLDLKFHDIPSTVAQACEAAVRLRVAMLTLHVNGGTAMLTEAVRVTRQAARRWRVRRPLLLGVTVLTSAPASQGRRRTVTAEVVRLARVARAAGLDGVVASAEELPALRRALGRRFLVVTPGIRPTRTDPGDQRRVVTPAVAVRGGADFLVVGRPITGAADPAQAARQIRQQMRQSKRPTTC